MEIKLTVPAEIVAALKLFAADKDTRYYLNGIALEIGATESRLIATNDTVLSCFRVESEQPEVTTPLRDIVIPNELLKNIKPKGVVEISIGRLETDESTVRPVTLTYDGVSVSGKTIDGRYPDWRRVIPAKVSGEPAQFDPRLIGNLAKAYTSLHGGRGMPLVGIGFNGEGAALVDLANENFVGVIMPLRKGAVTAPNTPPDWWADSLRVATDSAADTMDELVMARRESKREVQDLLLDDGDGSYRP